MRRFRAGKRCRVGVEQCRGVAGVVTTERGVGEKVTYVRRVMADGLGEGGDV
jgi:hypothetical protein